MTKKQDKKYLFKICELLATIGLLGKSKMPKTISQLEEEIFSLYNPIISYNNGRFRNMLASDTEGYQEFKKVFPQFTEMVKQYVDIVYSGIDNHTIDHVPLPPFIVFPMYSSSTIGWRMGGGEWYEARWMRMISNLSEEQLKEYCDKYDYPEWWLEDTDKMIPAGFYPRYYNLPWHNIRAQN